MSEGEDRVWHVGRLTPELDHLLRSGDERVRPFRILPFVVVSSLHPDAEEAPPGVVANYTPALTELGVAAAIDEVLWVSRSLRSTKAPNGNRWAAGLESAAYADWDFASKQIAYVTDFTVETTLGYPAVLNLSFQQWPGKVPGAHSLLSVSTQIASKTMPVIVAAGNWGAVAGSDRLNPIAKLPWVISVSATSDEAGDVRAISSSAGIEGKSGPTLSAFGEDPYSPGLIETSFAAPRASVQVILITAFLLQVRAMTSLISAQTPDPSPLLIHAGVDTGFSGFNGVPAIPLAALPYGVGVDTEACVGAVKALKALDIRCSFEPSPERVQSLLMRSASSTRLPRHEGGQGFVSYANTIALLEALTWADLLGAYGVHLPDNHSLGQSKVSDEDLGVLATIAHDSRIQYAVDFRTGEAHSTPLPPLP